MQTKQQNAKTHSIGFWRAYSLYNHLAQCHGRQQQRYVKLRHETSIFTSITESLQKEKKERKKKRTNTYENLFFRSVVTHSPTTVQESLLYNKLTLILSTSSKFVQIVHFAAFGGTDIGGEVVGRDHGSALRKRVFIITHRYFPALREKKNNILK